MPSTEKKVQHLENKIDKIDDKLNKKSSVILYEIFERYYLKRNEKLRDKKTELRRQIDILQDDEIKLELNKSR